MRPLFPKKKQFNIYRIKLHHYLQLLNLIKWKKIKEQLKNHHTTNSYLPRFLKTEEISLQVATPVVPNWRTTIDAAAIAIFIYSTADAFDAKARAKFAITASPAPTNR